MDGPCGGGFAGEEEGEGPGEGRGGCCGEDEGGFLGEGEGGLGGDEGGGLEEGGGRHCGGLWSEVGRGGWEVEVTTTTTTDARRGAERSWVELGSVDVWMWSVAKHGGKLGQAGFACRGWWAAVGTSAARTKTSCCTSEERERESYTDDLLHIAAPAALPRGILTS